MGDRNWYENLFEVGLVLLDGHHKISNKKSNSTRKEDSTFVTCTSFHKKLIDMSKEDASE